MPLTVDEALQAAWTHCAPSRRKGEFPRGFWPDVARVACHMMEQDTINPVLPFRPTICSAGSYPRPVKRFRRKVISTIKQEIENAKNADTKAALADLLAKTALA